MSGASIGGARAQVAPDAALERRPHLGPIAVVLQAAELSGRPTSESPSTTPSGAIRVTRDPVGRAARRTKA